MAPTIEKIEHWRPLGGVSPSELAPARIQLHWAAQIITSVGMKLIDADERNQRHLSTEWLDGPMILASARFGGALPIQVGLRPSQLALHLQDAQNMELITAYPLDGKTMKDAYGWLQETLTKLLGLKKFETKLPRTLYELPDDEVGKGGKFRFDVPEKFAELEKWIANGYHSVQAVESVFPGATEVRCHPQHFDMNSLLRLDPEGERTIRIGLCLGDETVTEPYYYATPWPQPADATVPTIGTVGTWHMAGWFGAIYKSSTLVTTTDPDAQAAQVAAFWSGSLEACERLLEREQPGSDDAAESEPDAGNA